MDELAEQDDDDVADDLDEEDLEDEELDEEDEEGEGDEDDYEKVAKKRQRQRNKKAMHKIEDIFLLTEADQQIRIEDKPERFMLRTIPVTPEPDEAELEKEAEWIYSQAFLNNLSITSEVSSLTISVFLSTVKNDHQ